MRRKQQAYPPASYAQEAERMCENVDFQNYCARRDRVHYVGKQHATDMVRGICGDPSDLIAGTVQGDQWGKMMSEFLAWRQAFGGVMIETWCDDALIGRRWKFNTPTDAADDTYWDAG